MSKLLKVTLLLALAVGLFGVYRHVSAQGGQSAKARGYDTAPTFHVDISDVLATKHVLEGTYINSGEYEGSAGSVSADTFTPIDTQLTVACPGKSGTCSIQADMLVQNGFNTTASNLNRVCLYVDGAPGPHCNSYADESTTDEYYTNAVSSEIVSNLAPGNHTVQMYFWSEEGAGASHYEANYHVYKP